MEQLVFIYLLAHADEDGAVDVIVDKITDDTGLTTEEVRTALATLESPDEHSRQARDEGRRIERLYDHREWGWQIVNYEHYRNIRNREERKRQNREAQTRYRRQHPSAPVSGRKRASSSVSGDQRRSAKSAEAEVEAEVERESGLATQGALTRAAVFDEVGAEAFERDVVDAYLGLDPRLDEEWANVARRTFLSNDPEWRVTAGQVRVPAEVVAAAEGNKRKVLELIQGLVKEKAIDRVVAESHRGETGGPKKAARVHVGEVYAICKHLGKERSSICLAVCERLFKAGIQRTDLLLAVARWYVDHVDAIRNPWAYFSPGGEGFAYLETRVNAENAIEEHEAMKRADRTWLNPHNPAEQVAG